MQESVMHNDWCSSIIYKLYKGKEDAQKRNYRDNQIVEPGHQSYCVIAKLIRSSISLNEMQFG